MVFPTVKAAFYKVGLPLFLITAGCIRPSVLSAVYVLFGLIAFRLPSIKTFSRQVPGSIRFFLVTLTGFAIIATVLQVAWQAVANFHLYKSDDDYSEQCANDSHTALLRFAGFEKYTSVGGADGTRVFLPELIVLISSLVSLIVTLCTSHIPDESTREETRGGAIVVRPTNGARTGDESPFSSALGDTLRRLSNMMIIILVGIVACIHPSLLSAFYFAVFLVVLTWYCMHKSIRHQTFNRIKGALIGYSGFHFFLLFLYQIPFFHSFFGEDSNHAVQSIPKLLGLTVILKLECSEWWRISVYAKEWPLLKEDLGWPQVINPLAVVALYVIMTWQLSFTRRGTHRYSRVDGDDDTSSVHEERRSTASTSVGTSAASTPPIRSSTAIQSRPRGNTRLLHDEEEGEVVRLRKMTSQLMDRQRISQILRRPASKPTVVSHTIVAICAFFFTQAYVVGLIAMMAWALMYHSVLGLVLLLTACVLWIFPDSRRAAFIFSPAIVAYVELLLIIQYICCMEIDDLVRAITKESTVWDDIGSTIVGLGISLVKQAVPRMTILLAKVLLSLPIFLILRLSFREKKFNELNERERRLKLENYGTFTNNRDQRDEDPVEPPPSPQHHHHDAAAFFSWLQRQLISLWLFVVLALLLVAVVQGKPSLFTVGFLCFFALLVIIFKTSFKLFRSLIFLILTLAIAYASLVIVAVYVYQFKAVQKKWKELVTTDEKLTEDIGFYAYENNGVALLENLAFPIILFVVTMLQLKVFHNKWKQLTDCTRATETTEEQSEQQPTTSANYEEEERKKKRLNNRVGTLLAAIVDIAWRIAEVHVSKAIYLIILYFVTINVYAMYLPLVMLLCVAACMPSTLTGLLSVLMCGYLCALAIFQAIFQLNAFPADMVDTLSGKTPTCNLTDENNRANYTFIEWVGFVKTNNTGLHFMKMKLKRHEREITLLELFNSIIISVVALVVQSIVVYRRAYQRAQRGEQESSLYVGGRRRVFPELAPREFDRSLKNFSKWLVDYAFYKFGVEICMILMAIDAWVRMDFLGAVVIVFLCIVALSSRSVVRAVWPILTFYLAIVIPLQFAMFIGLPPRECLDYPWTKSWGLPDELCVWLNLPRYGMAWDTGYLFADFILLVAVAAQLYVFKEENPAHPAGDNDSIYLDGRYLIRREENPHYDFVARQQSFVDYFKIAVFQYGHWVSLLMVLVAGLGGTSLFALGYICISFLLLWSGNNLYLMKNHKSTIAKWYGLVAYTVIVMLFKVGLQAVGCGFAGVLDTFCWLKQLFSITCVCLNVMELQHNTGTKASDCTVEANETRIGYDTVALAFLVFQLRVLRSWYFQHCIVEFRSEIVLANRGSVLKNQLIEKEMKEQNEQQQRKFDEIKRRTAAIRARYEELQKDGIEVEEAETYGQGSNYSSTDSLAQDDPLPFYNIPLLNDWDNAKRAGDYYMFDYDPAKDDLSKPIESFVPEMDPSATEYKKLDPTQLVHTAVSKDLDLQATLESAENAEGIECSEQRMIEAIRSKEDMDLEKENEGKLVWIGRFVLKFVGAGIDWFSVFLNRQSREHRYVAYVLQKEKEMLKAAKSDSLNDVNRRLTDILHDTKSERSLKVVHSESDIDKMEMEAINNWQRRSVMARLTNAVGYCAAAHTDIVCYMLAVIAHARCAGFITLPLPLMVFFWGTLSNPRPSKFFWVTMIGYTELCVVVKFICQFGFMPWMDTAYEIDKSKSPLEVTKLLGVQKSNYATFWETALLMALFFHRYMLRKLGLWKDANVSETFGGDEEDVGRTIEKGDVTSKTARGLTDGEGEQRATGGGETSRTVDPNEVEVEIVSMRETAGDEEKLRKKSSQAREERAESIGSKKSDDEQPDSARSKAESRGGFFRFIYQLFSPKFRYIRDLYPAMFALDILIFLVITFGYSSFGDGGSGSVVSDITSNRVPLTFVIMLIVSSFMIVIDRGLYLRKAVYGKLIYQACIIIFMHIWIFIVLPKITQRDAAVNTVAQFLYIVKCIYLLISAWQIRNGYPTLCIGNLLMHSYGMLNMIFFKIFMLVPFLWELRTTIDWTWTDTSMPLFDYFNMETFYTTIYNLKCARKFEQDYPAPRGEKKGVLVKYMMGLPMVIFIVLLIFCPLLAFSLLNTIGKVLKPETVLFSVAIEGYPPIYTIEAQGRELSPIAEQSLTGIRTNLTQMYNSSEKGAQDSFMRSRAAVSFLDEYSLEDIMVVQFRPEAQTFWDISDDSLTALKYAIAQNQTLHFTVHLEFTRPRADKTKEPVRHTSDMTFPMDEELRSRLKQALDGDSNSNLVLRGALPSFLVVPNEGEVKPADVLLAPTVPSGKPLNLSHTSLNLRLNGAKKFSTEDANETYTSSMLWTAQMRFFPNESAILDISIPNVTTTYGSRKLDYVQVVTFVDRVFPSYFGQFVQGGIIAMYLAVVVFVARTIRGVFATNPQAVQITEIPNPDHLLKICLDIYLVREAKDFVLEQDLFAKLIFLFRSPATLIKWTRNKRKAKRE